MDGYELFLKKLNQYSNIVKENIMYKIFGINFLVFDFVSDEDNFFLRGYDGRSYYQFRFVLNEDNISVVTSNEEKDIFVCDIYVKTVLLNHRFNELFLKKHFVCFLKIIYLGDISYFDSFL